MKTHENAKRKTQGKQPSTKLKCFLLPEAEGQEREKKTLF
jgi:hypothetical protein